MASPSNVLILTAIAMEYRHVGRECVVGFRDDTIVRPRDPFERPAGWGVSIQKIGIKAIGLPAIEIPGDCKLIIMAGLAGGLDPALAIGDVVASTPPAWLKLPDTLRQGKIITADHAITTVTGKAELFAKTHAAAVDMESGIVAEWAKRKAIDFITIRAISDTANDAIDPRVMNLVDPYGRTRPTNVGAYILGNPLRIKSLMQLGKNSELAARNLGKAVGGAVESLPKT